MNNQARKNSKSNDKEHTARLSIARASFKQLFETPITSLLNIILIAIAISIPVVLKLGVDNFQQWAGYNDNGLEITLYLKPDIVDHAGVSLKEQITRWPGVSDAEYISRDQALEDLKQLGGLDQALSQLKQNPLPSSVRVVLPHSHDIQTLAQSIVAKSEQLPEVESVLFDMEWFGKAQAIINVGQQIYNVITGFLSFGVLLVIGNTVRLTIDNHKEEILVSKLVGATDRYVRRPFIYMGMWVGLIGAALGLSLCLAGWWLLNRNLDALSLAYASQISLAALDPLYAVGLVASCATLGFLGAWLMCNSQLSKISPE